MERDGQIVKTRRGGYGIVDKMNLVRGYVWRIKMVLASWLLKIKAPIFYQRAKNARCF